MAQRKPMVAVTHKFVTSLNGHEIIVSRTGNLNTGKRTVFRGLFPNAIKEGKKKALAMGNGTRLWIHGARENTTDYVVKNHKLVKV